MANSSFPPSFSSFPDLNPGPSKKPRTSEPDNPHHEVSSNKSRKVKKGAHGERKRTRTVHIRSSNPTSRDVDDEILKIDEDMKYREKEAAAYIFYSDRKETYPNITPFVRAAIGKIETSNDGKGGRSILGLPHGLIVTYRDGKGVEVGSSSHRKMSGLTDSSSRALLAAPPTHTITQSDNARTYQETDGFLSLSSRHHPSNDEPSYRSITKGGSDTSSESSSSDEDDNDSLDHGPETLTLTSHQTTLKLLEQQLAADASSADKWLLLLNHSLSTIPTSSKNATKARSEISLSIIARALAADAQNRSSTILRIKYMKNGEELWHESKIRAEWENALKLGSVEIWMEWFEWRVRKGNKGVDGVVEDALRILGALGHDEAAEIAKLRIFWRVAVVFQNAGFSERATAMFQAQAELTFKTPQALSEKSLQVRLNALEEFWESETSRVGEDSSQGWAAWLSSGQTNEVPRSLVIPPQEITEIDPYRQWAVQEFQADHTLFLPSRSSDQSNDADPYSAIIFSDIQHLLLDIRSLRAKRAFRLVWLSVLGLHIPGFYETLSNPSEINWDDRWNHGHLRRSSYLDTLFPEIVTQGRLSTESYAGVIIGREKEYASGFGPVRYWGYGVLGSLGTSVGSKEVTKDDRYIVMWSKEDLEGLDEVFIQRVFSHLRQGADDWEWDTLALAFEAVNSMKSAVKRSRMFLSTSRDSLAHWSAHAQLERMRNRLDEARKIYQTVLIDSSDSNPRGKGILWWDWAEMEWSRGGCDQALDVILRSVGVEGRGGVVILRCKRNLQDAIKEETQWKEREAWIKLRALLDILTTNDPFGALHIFDVYLNEEGTHAVSLESLTVACLLMIYRYAVVLKNPMPPSVLRDRVEEGLERYPSNSMILGIFLEGEKGQGVWGRVRAMLGDGRNRAKDIARRVEEVWIARWEKGRWISEVERTRSGLAAAVENERTRASHVLWRVYIEFEIRAGQLHNAKKLLFRALGECPLVKEFYLLAFSALRSVFNAKELNGIADTMVERGLRLRQGLDEGLEGWNGVVDEDGGPESSESGDEIAENARELRRLMPY